MHVHCMQRGAIEAPHSGGNTDPLSILCQLYYSYQHEAITRNYFIVEQCFAKYNLLLMIMHLVNVEHV